MSQKGTAITLEHGASVEDAINAVREKYAEKRATASGWHGQAVVNVKPNDDGKLGATYIVKGLKNGFEAYGLLGRVLDVVETTAGAFESAAAESDDDGDE
jgi:hypothetical protein